MTATGEQGLTLITGIAGFCGSYLAELMIAQGLQVIGLDRPGVNLSHLQQVGHALEVLYVDLVDADSVRHVIEQVKPAQIAHLAALTDPRAPFPTLCEVNVYGTIHLLEAVKAMAPNCTVLITGSSAQYGPTRPDENPIVETQPFRPVTQYAVTKATQDLLGQMYSAAGLRLIRTRTFNIIGPRQGSQFVSATFARQIAQIEAGLREPVIEVGNLESRRDFVDVRDVAAAYVLVLARGTPGAIYNVCTGRDRSMGQLLQGLLEQSPLQDIEVRQVPERMQRADVPVQVGSYARLAASTGWQPRISWEQTLADLLAYWRETVAR